MIAAASVAVFSIVYGSVLLAGLLTLPSPAAQIQEPWFSLMEVLIILIAPSMVAFTSAIHASAAEQDQSMALAAVAFMSMCSGVTCVVHFATLTLGHHPAIAAQSWARLVFSFQWPSVAYALDILAWDIFFPLGALLAASTIHGAGRARAARRVMFASAALAFCGLAGVPLGNMQVRNLGIIGYALLFPVSAALMAMVFRRSALQNEV